MDLKRRYLSHITAFQLSLAFVFVSTVSSNFLDTEQSSQSHSQQKRVDEAELVEVCTSVQSFEQLESAVSVDLVTVEVHPEAWVFATRCRVPGKPCRGVDTDVQSICRPKKSWVQVYGRTSGDTWRPHWVAVDTACVCSIRRKKVFAMSTNGIPLTGRNFLP